MEGTERKRILGYVRMAGEKIELSRISLIDGKVRSSLSCSYYAMFNMACCLVLLDGKIPSKHKFVISYVNQHYCNTDKLPRHLGAMLKNAEELRLKADYDPEYEEEFELAQELYSEAEEYLKTVKELLVAEGAIPKI